jgi:hypothetical protein
MVKKYNGPKIIEIVYDDFPRWDSRNKKKAAKAALKMCPGLDSNQHGFPPPPQDGASTNFATWAGLFLKTKEDSRLSSFACKFFVIPLGLEPRTHTLKVYCSTS